MMIRIPMDRFELKSLDLCKVILQIDETVDPEKQQFLQDKAIKAETKDIVVEGKEENRKGKREEKEEENNIDHPVIQSESLKVET